jgi:GNAT superfamily N-acetyltransferase
MMDLTIRSGHDTTERDIRALLELDIQLYGADAIDIPRALRRWHRAPDLTVVAWDGDALVGGAVLYPVRTELYRRAAASDVMVDDDLPPEEVVVPARGVRCCVLALDTAIAEPYRGRGLFTHLMRESRATLRALLRTGCGVDCLFGYALSPAGLRTAEHSYGAVPKRTLPCGAAFFQADEAALLLRLRGNPDNLLKEG